MPDAVLEQACEGAIPPDAGSRALVPLTLRTTHADASQTVRPDARFVAHLIATGTFAPQTRTLRRTAPDDGARSYAEAFQRQHLVAASNLELSRLA